MRDILFRAKRVKDGKWVEGFYSYRAFEGKLDHIIFQPAIAEYDYTEWGYLVDPTTVGQYIGLKDKNGNKIFEGDILKSYSYLRDEICGDPCIVKYGNFNCTCCEGIYGWYFHEGDIRYYDSYVIVGNIYDNPELLEAKP